MHVIAVAKYLCVHVIVGSLVCTCDPQLRAQVILRASNGLCVYM